MRLRQPTVQEAFDRYVRAKRDLLRIDQDLERLGREVGARQKDALDAQNERNAAWDELNMAIDRTAAAGVTP